MDLLEAEKAAIERAIYFRVADLLNLEVDLLFYDTTSVHFEVDDEDRRVGWTMWFGTARHRGSAFTSQDGRGDAPRES
jgi:hypothetical protein